MNNLISGFSKIINDFPPNVHYNGWYEIVNNLTENIKLVSDGIILDTFIDYCLWTNKPILKSPWIGILHGVCMDCPTHKTKHNINDFLASDWFRLSKENCVAIVVLSEHTKNILKTKITIPVYSTHLPKSVGSKFNIENYFASPKILHIGSHCRNFSAFIRFKTDILKNMIISNRKLPHALNCFTYNNITPSELCNVLISDNHLNNQQYESEICNSVGFSYYYDAAATNGLLEYIVSNTPIVVNRHPAIVEYIGEDYPLFYEDINHCPDNYLKSYEYIKKTVKYLENRAKMNIFKQESFNEFFKLLANNNMAN